MAGLRAGAKTATIRAMNDENKLDSETDFPFDSDDGNDQPTDSDVVETDAIDSANADDFALSDSDLEQAMSDESDTMDADLLEAEALEDSLDASNGDLLDVESDDADVYADRELAEVEADNFETLVPSPLEGGIPATDFSFDDMRFAPARRQAVIEADDASVIVDPEAHIDTIPAHPAAISSRSEAAESNATPVSSDEVDLDAALASVAMLDEYDFDADYAIYGPSPDLAPYDGKTGERERAPRPVALDLPHGYRFPRPPLTTLNRGQMNSVIPALLLIVAGAWLTFTLTLAQTPPDSILVVGALAAIVVLTLLGHWLASGRWSRGAFFFAALLVLVAAVVVYLTLPNSLLTLGDGWPLLLIAGGLAIVLTAVLARPTDSRLALPGLMLIVAGSAALSFTLRLLPGVALASIAPLWPFVLALLLLFWLLPLVFRRDIRGESSPNTSRRSRRS
ncbi:MAG: hypothetical protein H7175_22715 [Burkholderiales bacterium]|nr:hypothetical protein [Anaerolineae bacterium]